MLLADTQETKLNRIEKQEPKYNTLTMKINKIITIILLAAQIESQQSLYAQVLPQDSLALVAFYNSTGGPNWTNHTGWITGPVNSWYGVTVEGNRVIKLHIYSNNLIGELPDDIGLLDQLQLFVVANESGIIGQIPNTIYQLYNLTSFGIGNCSITGSISNSIGNLTKLKEINLQENNLSGTIPPEIGNLDSLLFLNLHHNQLTGTIPPEIGNCSQLLELRLNNNQLTGTIPSELANCNQLQVLDLSSNQFIGEVPVEMAGVTSYQFMYLNNNRLTGIPPWNHTWLLNVLAIGGNCMTFEDLEPHFVGYMWYNYYPQDSMQTVIDTLLPKGSNYNIYSGSLGQYTTYYWFHNGVYMPGTENVDTLKLTNISEADAGVYTCNAQSSICKEPNGMPMVLFRRPVTIGITVGMVEPDAQNLFTVYPNPCTDYLNIKTTAILRDGLIQLINMYGQVMQSVPWINSTLTKTIHIGSLPAGVYFLTLHDKQETFTKKIIIN